MREIPETVSIGPIRLPSQTTTCSQPTRRVADPSGYIRRDGCRPVRG